MARKVKHISIDRIISKAYRDFGMEDISEIDLIEWTAEALEAIGAVSQLEDAVSFVEVKDYRAELPMGLHHIIQVARNNFWSKDNTSLCPMNIIMDSTTEEMLDTESEAHPNTKVIDTSLPVPIDCTGTPITGYDLAYYRPYFDLQYEYHGWNTSKFYMNHYTPVRLANHSFFETLVCDEEDDKVYHANKSDLDEYNIQNDTMTFSFKEGSVAIAYRRQYVDPETGYPLVPDEVSTIQAITSYIGYRYFYRLWLQSREGAADKMSKLESDWHWYCQQAGTKAMMLYGTDEYENLKDMRSTLMPRNNRYYGFFGKLSRPEYRGFMDPNKRNFRLRGI